MFDTDGGGREFASVTFEVAEEPAPAATPEELASGLSGTLMVLVYGSHGPWSISIDQVQLGGERCLLTAHPLSVGPHEVCAVLDLLD